MSPNEVNINNRRRLRQTRPNGAVVQDQAEILTAAFQRL
jgi:hypothetical protein